MGCLNEGLRDPEELRNAEEAASGAVVLDFFFRLAEEVEGVVVVVVVEVLALVEEELELEEEEEEGRGICEWRRFASGGIGIGSGCLKRRVGGLRAGMSGFERSVKEVKVERSS